MKAVVTGGSSGIGRATVLELAHRGVWVYDLSRHTGVDVRDAATVQSAYDLMTEPPELLVASAGIIAPHHVEFPYNEDAEWDDVMATNVRGAYIVAKEHARRLIEAGRPGKILLLGSPSGRRPSLPNLAYGVSKAAVHALGLGLAQGLEPHGIKVYVLSPSHVDTPMLRSRGFNDLDDHALLTAEATAVQIANLLLEPNSLDGQVIYMGREVTMKQR